MVHHTMMDQTDLCQSRIHVRALLCKDHGLRASLEKSGSSPECCGWLRVAIATLVLVVPCFWSVQGGCLLTLFSVRGRYLWSGFGHRAVQGFLVRSLATLRFHLWQIGKVRMALGCEDRYRTASRCTDCPRIRFALAVVLSKEVC